MLKHLREYIDFDKYDTEEIDSRLTDKDFVKFLNSWNAYYKFVHNLTEFMKRDHYDFNIYWDSVEDFCHKVKRVNYISTAFMWDETDEGYWFWSRINSRWWIWLTH